MVCDPPNTLLFADRRYVATANGTTDRGTTVEIHNLDTGEIVERPFVKVRAHPKGLIWATGGTGGLFYRGRNYVATDLIGAFFDQVDNLDLADLVGFLAPLVSAGDLHLLLGTAAEAFYIWFPAAGGGAPVVEQIRCKIIPSRDTAGFFGGIPQPDGSLKLAIEEFNPPRGSSPETISGLMRPLFERAIAYAQENAGPGCDVAGPIDVALVGPAGARVLEGSA